MEENYYTKQINRLPQLEKGHHYAIQIRGEGNQTNWMNITPEQLQKIRDIFVESEEN